MCMYLHVYIYIYTSINIIAYVYIYISRTHYIIFKIIISSLSHHSITNSTSHLIRTYTYTRCALRTTRKSPWKSGLNDRIHKLNESFNYVKNSTSYLIITNALHMQAVRMAHDENEPIQEWFELSYSCILCMNSHSVSSIFVLNQNNYSFPNCHELTAHAGSAHGAWRGRESASAWSWKEKVCDIHTNKNIYRHSCGETCVQELNYRGLLKETCVERISGGDIYIYIYIYMCMYAYICICTYIQ